MQRSAEYSWLNDALIAKNLTIILDGFALTVEVIQQSGLRHVVREYYMRYSVYRHASPPQILAYVTLAEGVTLLTEVIGSDYEELSINDDVTVKFRVDGDGRHIPVFGLVK